LELHRPEVCLSVALCYANGRWRSVASGRFVSFSTGRDSVLAECFRPAT